jgi:hypothetical protein
MKFIGILLIFIIKANAFNIINYMKSFKIFNPYDDLQKIDSNTKSVTEPKFCINCKFYLNHENKKFGRCALHPILNNKDQMYYLVSGETPNTDIKYHYCSVARELQQMCGENATKYDPILDLII